MAARDLPPPPHDCRITLRCLKSTFGLALGLEQDFESLRGSNSLIDIFFERRQNDPAGGEGGERIGQIRTRPAFALHYRRMRAATWFDLDHPPQGLVWLLGAEMHDERHKGSADAYDIFEGLDAADELFPVDLDYELLEFHRRRWDSNSFGEDVARDTADLLERSLDTGGGTGELAGVPARLVVETSNGLTTIYGAVSLEPVTGSRSGYEFPLTQERFLLVTEAVRQAAASLLGTDVLAAESYTFPGGLHRERAFLLVFEAPAGR